MLERTRESLESSPIIMRNGYPYVVNPILDGVPRMDPQVLLEVTDRMMEISNFDCDVILAPEAMSLPFAAIISVRTGIPYCVIRKRAYGCEGEIVIEEVTGYSRNKMYINDIRPGERVAIIDDVISTGGTLKSIVQAVEDRGCIVSEIVVAIDKSKDIRATEKMLGHPVKTAISLDIVDGRPVCRD